MSSVKGITTNCRGINFFQCWLNDLTEATQQYLEEEFGPDMASRLSRPLYYKQVEYTDKKEKSKTKNDESASPVLFAKLICSDK